MNHTHILNLPGCDNLACTYSTCKQAHSKQMNAARDMAQALRRIHGYASGVTPTADAVTALLEIEGYARVALAKAGIAS